MKILSSLFLGGFLFTSSLFALDDGIYILKKGPDDSEIRLPGGSAGAIDRRLSTNEFNITVESLDNWNDSFSVSLDINPDFSTATHAQLAIALDGKLYTPVGLMREQLELLTGPSRFLTVDEKMAARIAAAGRVTARLRKHPGHKLAIRFVCDANKYKQGKAWKVRDAQKEGAVLDVLIQIKNLGEQSVFLTAESDTDARSSCLLLVPDESWAPFCKDVRGESQRVTFSYYHELRAGQSMTVRKENLFNWFTPQVHGQFIFIGAYKVEIYERAESRRPIWVEQISESFAVTFEE